MFKSEGRSYNKEHMKSCSIKCSMSTMKTKTTTVPEQKSPVQLGLGGTRLECHTKSTTENFEQAPERSCQSRYNNSLPDENEIKLEVEEQDEKYDSALVAENLEDTPSIQTHRKRRRQLKPFFKDDFVYDLSKLTRRGVSVQFDNFSPQKVKKSSLKNSTEKKTIKVIRNNNEGIPRKRIFLKMIKPTKKINKSKEPKQNVVSSAVKSKESLKKVTDVHTAVSSDTAGTDSSLKENGIVLSTKQDISLCATSVKRKSGSIVREETEELLNSDSCEENKAYRSSIPGSKRNMNKRCKIANNKNIEEEVCYDIIDNATQRGSKRLVGSDGFTYNVAKYKSTDTIIWRCSHRPHLGQDCRAVVSIKGDIYRRRFEHCHPPDPHAFIKCLITAECKKKSLTDFTRQPKVILQRIFEEHSELMREAGHNFNLEYLVRNFNRSRRIVMLKYPILTQEKITKLFPSEFLIDDIIFKKSRHMLFATKKQLSLLEKADMWYIDLTNKFVKEPFSHVLTISAYVCDGILSKEEEEVKLKPLVFVIMSSVEYIDFTKVLRSVIRRLRKPLLVRNFALDYYTNLWRSVQNMFFNCKLYGCAWKFGQSIWAKIQTLGVEQYQVGLYDEIHKLLKLPFAPHREIPITFEAIKQQHLSAPGFDALNRHIELHWLSNPLWKIPNWCTFMRPFRTKIEVLGWHYLIQNEWKGYLIFEHFVCKLREIAESIPSSARPVHQKSVTNFYVKHDDTPQGKLFKLWSEEYSYETFLSRCCELSEPPMEGMLKKMLQDYGKTEEILKPKRRTYK